MEPPEAGRRARHSTDPADSILFFGKAASAYREGSANHLDDSEEEESSGWDSQGLFNRESSGTRIEQDEEDQLASDIHQVSIKENHGMAASVAGREADGNQSMTDFASYAAFEEEIILKAAHSDPFSEETNKMQIFIQQVDNKIADAAGTTSNRKIRYATSLLRETVAE